MTLSWDHMNKGAWFKGIDMQDGKLRKVFSKEVRSHRVEGVYTDD